MAVVLIIGPFFAGHLRPSETTQGRASMLANMRYHTAVIISLFTALGSLASSSRKLMRLSAHAERILELEDTAEEINAGRPSICILCKVLAPLNHTQALLAPVCRCIGKLRLAVPCMLNDKHVLL